MDLGSISALLLLTVPFGLLAVLVVRAQRQAAARAEAVRARGWRLETRPRGFVVEGGDLVPWVLTVSKPQNGSPTARWEAPAERTDGVVLVGPKLPSAVARLDLGSAMAQLALRALLGDDARHLAGARPVEVGSAAFRERFSVIASTAAHAEALVDEGLEEALSSGPQGATILRWHERLQVRVPGGAPTFDDIAAIVALGEAAARRCGFGP